MEKEELEIVLKTEILNKEVREMLLEDLEILAILKEYLFFSPSFYHDQANWQKEYISMSVMEKPWTNEQTYEKVKAWCFKNKIRGTK